MRHHRGLPRTLYAARRALADERRTSRALARECGYLWREMRAWETRCRAVEQELDDYFALIGVRRPDSKARKEDGP